MRDSPSLDLIPELIKNNCFLKLFDPEGMREAKKFLKNSIKTLNGVMTHTMHVRILML